MTSDASLDWLVSVDDHILQPRDLIDDAHGTASIDEIGEDNIMCETDYPYSDSTWPDSIGVVERRIEHLPAPVQYKVLRGNAERLYRFTPAEPPALAHA